MLLAEDDMLVEGLLCLVGLPSCRPSRPLFGPTMRARGLATLPIDCVASYGAGQEGRGPFLVVEAAGGFALVVHGR